MLMAAIKFFNLSFFTKEWNLCKMVSGFASNLYTYDESVAAEDIAVLDYQLQDTKLSVIPLNREVILPVSGIVSAVGKDYIEIQSTSATYRIYHITASYRLYQYYKKGMILGKSEQYAVVSEHIEHIACRLVIQHESV